MPKYLPPLPLILLTAPLLTGGCASHAPTIAHTHIGHTVDGWPSTPNNEGLFVTAEETAQSAVTAAEAATAANTSLSSVKRNIAQVIWKTNPDTGASSKDGRKQYGVKNALAEAAHHLTFAADSPDASTNILSSSKSFSDNAVFVLNRCDLIAALGDEILDSSSVEEASILSQELLKLVRANRDGDDSNGDGIIGSSPDEYGLKQLRTQLDSIIKRENPPYTTVDSWYLFNLIRLPSGEWIFRKLGLNDGGNQGFGY